MNFAIYARVSTAQQAEHGYSLQTQVDACTKKAMELGATSVKNYIDDGYSGAYLERPALKRSLCYGRISLTGVMLTLTSASFFGRDILCTLSTPIDKV